MANQDLRINVKTGYDGTGITQAGKDLTGLRASIGQTTQQLGRLGGSFGKLGGVMSKASFLFGSFGGQLGVFGQTVGGLAGTVGGLTSSFGLLANPVTLSIAAVTGLYKAADYFTQKAEKAKEAAANLRKEMHRLRVEAEIARETAEDNREEKRAKKMQESQKRANELATALWKVHDAEKARQLAGNDAKRQSIQQSTLDAMEKETDPTKKELIGAQGGLQLAKFNGAESVKKAVQETRDQIAKLKSLTNLIGSDGVDQKKLNIDITAQRKNVETAKIREQMARDKMEADVKAAEIKVKDAKIEYEGAQARKEIDRDEKAYQKMIDDDIKAAEKAQKDRDEKDFNEASERQAAMEEKLASIDRQIAQARKSVDRIAARRETIQKGMAADNSGFVYKTDADGKLTDSGQVARARRYAERADRDAKSQQMGENATRAKQERMYDLLAKKDTPGGLSKREQRELGDLQAWDDQFNGEKNAKENLNNLENEREQTQKDMLEELKKISALADKLGLK